MSGINIVDLSRGVANTDVADRLGALTTPAVGSVNAQLALIQGYVDTLESLVGALTTPDANSINGQLASIRGFVDNLERFTSDTSVAATAPTAVNVTTTAAATLAAAAAGGVQWRRISLFINSVTGASLNLAIGTTASATVRTVQVPTNTLITLKTLLSVSAFAIGAAVLVDVTIET